jgi:HD-GYP domain-containing protein (c-di-GMP phosphodiesterase class II)
MNKPEEKQAREIPISALKAGMIFTEPVYIDDDNLLVPPGIAIKQKDLTRLLSWGILSVKTGGWLVKTPETISPAAEKQGLEGKTAAQSLADAGDSESPGTDPKKGSAESAGKKPQGDNSYQEYIAFIQRLDRVFSPASAGITPDALIVNELTSQLLIAIRGKRDRFVGYILEAEIKGREITKSSLNSAILSAMTAQELLLPSHRVMQITTGALLHDIGMLRLPREILSKRGGLSQEEARIMQTHPLSAYRLISAKLDYPDSVGSVVLQHHERWDGQGYPSGIAGENIGIGARIVSVADAFEAMICKRPYRNSMAGYEAMKTLMSDNQSRFDPNVLRAFVAIMGIYPIGSIVVLNDGAIARVMEVQSGAPLKPKVQILINSSGGKEQNGALISLLTEKKYFISRTSNSKELAAKHA